MTTSIRTARQSRSFGCANPQCVALPVRDCACRRWRGRRIRAGFTLVEVLIVVSMLGLLMSVAATRFTGLGNDLENATTDTAGFLRQVRARAMSTTSAYRVVIDSDTQLRTEHARRCADGDWTQDPSLTLRLRERTAIKGDDIVAGDTVLCFNSRGIADATPELTIRDHAGYANRVQVFLGGGVRIQRGGSGE